MSKAPALLVLAASAALAACGGGGGGGGSGNSPGSVQTVRTFADGSGVARVDVEQDGERIVGTVIASDVSALSTDGNPADIGDLDVDSQRSNAYGTIYMGSSTVNGVPVDVLAYEDFGEDVAVVYFENESAGLLLAGGAPASSIPTGTFTYAGTNLVGASDGTIEDGTFNMLVNFTQGTADLAGNTPNSSITAEGLAVDAARGRFSGKDISIGYNGESLSGSIDGNFHGPGAVGVTGVYHDNASIPSVAGAIAGTRQD